MKFNFRSLFSHLDLVDILLAAGFVIVVTWIGYSLVKFPLWLIFPAAALVLLALAKIRRDKMRANPPRD